MFEDKTFENLLSSALSIVPPHIDKREGSVIYDALAPTCVQLAEAYAKLDDMFSILFLMDKDGNLSTNMENLRKFASEKGIEYLTATKAKRSYNYEGTKPPIGSRVFEPTTNLVFVVTKTNDPDSNGKGTGEVEAETAGTESNAIASGSNLIPLKNIVDLTSMDLGDVLIPAEDDETKEHLFQRVVDAERQKDKDWNKAQYLKVANDYAGVERAKVFPLEKGNNTVTLVILGSNYRMPSDDLVDQFQAYMDPESKGLGEGKVQIGSKVYVEKPEGVNVDITANVRLYHGAVLADIQSQFQSQVQQLIDNEALLKDSLKIVKIGAILADLVYDYEELKINNADSNVTLTSKQIPVLGSVVLNAI